MIDTPKYILIFSRCQGHPRTGLPVGHGHGHGHGDGDGDGDGHGDDDGMVIRLQKNSGPVYTTGPPVNVTCCYLG